MLRTRLLGHVVQPQTTQRRFGHSVRVIALQEIPRKAQPGQVATVKAGYARNYLIPKKHAVYATKENFEKYNVVDTPEETEQVALDPEKKEADRLSRYLRNKSLKIWRNVPDPSNEVLSPGLVNAKNVKSKLSKQLLIDLEQHERIHLSSDPSEDIPEASAFGPLDEPCKAEIRKLGDYWARISLKGDHSVFMKVQVLKR